MSKSNFLFRALVLFFCLGVVTASSQASMESEIAYTKGLSYLQEGKWDLAAREFRQIQSDDPEWADAQYHLGLSYNQLEDFEQAADVLRALLKKEPLRSEARAELAFALSRLGREEDARREASQVREIEVAPVKEEAEIPDRMKKRFFRFFLTTGTQYDSNVFLSPSDLSPSVGIPAENIDDSKGLRQNFLGYAEVAPWIKPKTQLGANYTLYHSHNFKFSVFDYDYEPSDYNFQDHRVEVFAAQDLGSILVQLPYTLDILLKGDGLDRYWTGHSIAPNVFLPVRSFFFLKGFLRFRSDNFNAEPDRPEQNQDAINVAFGIDPSINFGGGERGYFLFSYQLDLNFADGDDWDYLGNRIQGALKLKPWTHFLTLQAGLHWRKFSNVNSLDNEERDDKEISLGGSVGMEGKIFHYSLGVTYITNSSNIELYAYDRLLATVTIGFKI